MFQTKVVEKIKTHILLSITFLFENRAVYEIIWKKYSKSGEATDNNKAHAYFMLDA
jgi:hypothetical protein